MENWGKINLEDVCLIKKGEQLNKLDLESAGDYPCINGGISPSGYTEKWNTKANTITISEGGNSCGFVNMLRTDFWSGGHCYSLLEVKDKIDNEFLYYALKGRESLIMDLRVGSGLPNIQQKAIKKFEFIYPKDKTEQTSIANILSKTDQAIAHTEALIAKYNRIKTGLMQDLLTKGIDENGNIRNEQTHEFKDSPLGRIPQEWEVKSLLELTLKIGDGTHSSVKFSDNDEVPFLFVSCVRPNRIDWTKITSISLDEYKKISKGKEPKRGTVLYSLVGSYGNAVTLNNDDKLSFQRHIGFIETKRDILLPEFLTLFFNSIYGNLQANDLAVGNAQKTITLGALSEFKILKPSIEEQKLIIEKISIVEKHISQIEAELTKLQSLKTGLMQDLLSGKVRVNNLKKEKLANEKLDK